MFLLQTIGIGEIAIILVAIIIAILMIASMWKAFEKAGHEGWKAIIPLYNYYIMCKIGDKSGWWIILMIIPYINIIGFLIVSVGIARNFNKGSGFGVGLTFLSFIFWPILGFGDAEYKNTSLQIEDNLVE